MFLNKLMPLCRRSTVFRNLVRFTSEEKGPASKGVIPTKSEKFFLVWYGKYKTANEIPEYIPISIHTHLRNRIRISLANYAMLITLIACLGMVYTGRSAAKKGESVQQMNIDWHKEMDEKYKKDHAN